MNKKIILSRNNVRFEPTSHQDRSGRILYWDTRVFREITDQDTWNLYTRLLTSDICPELFDAGLVKTWIPDDIELEGAMGLLEHEKIDYILAPAEWTLAMLWDAARMVVNCSQILSREECGFKDGHQFNIQFNHCNPTWIDFGSITDHIPYRMWHPQEFRRHFIVPLWLAKWGGELGRRIAYELIREYPAQPQTGYIIFSQTLLRFLPVGYYLKMKRFRRHLSNGEKKEAERFFLHLRTYLDTLKPDETPRDRPGHQSRDGSFRDVLEEDTVLQLVQEMHPESVIDFKAGDGGYSFACENAGCTVISVELDEIRLNALYKKAQSEHRRIIPVKMDILYPTSPYLMGLGFRSSFDRLKADVALVLSFLQDAILHQGCSMELCTGIVSAYSKKASIIEFVSPKEAELSSGTIPPGYSRENLVNEMGKQGFSLKQERCIGPQRDILVFVRDEGSIGQ